MHTRSLATLILSVTAIAPFAAVAQTRSPAPAGTVVPATPASQVRRDDWQRASDIFAALNASAGSRIADLGAGEGWLTQRLARHVGPNGRVFAVDISEAALGRLAETLQKESLGNVELVLGEEDDPRLPFGTLDGVVIVNAYHEMTRRVPILDGIKRALRPGGLVVIVDNSPPDSVQARKSQVERHMLALDFARDDLEAQGFEIVSSDPKFVDRKLTDHTMQQWLLVARRSAK
jgi:ubiquinone/menaquinone biosynthesis C-methylase UbiE